MVILADIFAVLLRYFESSIGNLTITNGTAAGKFDIVLGRGEKHSCCWHLTYVLHYYE